MVAANSESYSIGTVAIWILRLDEYGDTMQTHIYDETVHNESYQIINAPDSGYYFIGYCYYLLDATILLLRLNDNCDIVRTRKYSNFAYGPAYICRLTSSNLMITGLEPTGLEVIVRAMKIDSLGDTLWTRAYHFHYLDEYPRYIIPISDNHAVIFWNGNSGYPEYPIESGGGIFEIDSNGEIYRDCWGDGLKGLSSATIILDSNYVISMFDGRIYKFNVLLSSEWYYSYPPLNLYTISSTNDSCVILGGRQETNIALVKTNEIGRIDYIEEIQINPEQIALSVFPNPFNSSCAITVNVGAGLTPAQIEIYDLRGNVVTPYSSRQSRDSFVPLDKGDRGDASASAQGVYIWTPDKKIPTGIYLVRATAGNETITKRIVYLR